MSMPLEVFRVVEWSHWAAGAATCIMLGDLVTWEPTSPRSN